MATMHGTAVVSGFKYRFIIAALLVYIVYLHWRYNSDLSLIVDKTGSSLMACESYAESVVVKLLVVFEHKKRLEKVFNVKRVASLETMKVQERMLRICQENLTLLSTQIDDCRNSKADQTVLNDKERIELHRLRAQTATLTSLNASLNEIILENEKFIGVCVKDKIDLQNSLSSCQKAIKNYVGASPIADYTLNKTAYFERSYKVSDTLAFDRDRDAFKPPTLLPARELIRKLAEKPRRQGEENDQHPDDRVNDDDYVNEVPNVNEKDYKEHRQF